MSTAARKWDEQLARIVFVERPGFPAKRPVGFPPVTRMRRMLEEISVQSAESDPLAAAIRIRGMLKHRSLVIVLTDLDDANVADQLARARPSQLDVKRHLGGQTNAHSDDVQSHVDE